MEWLRAWGLKPHSLVNCLLNLGGPWDLQFQSLAQSLWRTYQEGRWVIIGIVAINVQGLINTVVLSMAFFFSEEFPYFFFSLSFFLLISKSHWMDI